jgi:hypothetical protein
VEEVKRSMEISGSECGTDPTKTVLSMDGVYVDTHGKWHLAFRPDGVLLASARRVNEETVDPCSQLIAYMGTSSAAVPDAWKNELDNFNHMLDDKWIFHATYEQEGHVIVLKWERKTEYALLSAANKLLVMNPKMDAWIPTSSNRGQNADKTQQTTLSLIVNEVHRMVIV